MLYGSWSSWLTEFLSGLFLVLLMQPSTGLGHRPIGQLLSATALSVSYETLVDAGGWSTRDVAQRETGIVAGVAATSALRATLHAHGPGGWIPFRVMKDALGLADAKLLAPKDAACGTRAAPADDTPSLRYPFAGAPVVPVDFAAPRAPLLLCPRLRFALPAPSADELP